MRRILTVVALVALVAITVGATFISAPTGQRAEAAVKPAKFSRERYVYTPRITIKVFSNDRAPQLRKYAVHRPIRRVVAPSWSYATASWYDDAGSTACGYHARDGNGVANKYLACGTLVTFSYHGNIVTATVDDRGPYIAGRDWDLNQNTAAALGFGGVDSVGYYIH